MVQMSVPIELWVEARFFHGLADPSRLALLQALRQGERTVSEVAAVTRIGISSASRHLRCLAECGLVEARTDWRYTHYRLADQVEELLAANEAFIATVADRIAACRRPEMSEGLAS